MSATDAPRPARPSSRPAIPVKAVLWGLAALVVLLLALDTTYRDAGEATEAEKAAFNPERFGEENFEAKVLPALEEKAVPIKELVPELRKDPDAAGEQFGHREGTSPYNFAVTAEGVVQEPENGLAEIKVKGLKDTRVSMQVGPALNGTSVRDASGLISFDQFVNQVEYADAATALNQQVKDKVLSAIEPDQLAGKRVSVLGTFSYLDPSVVTLTPVRLEVRG